MPGGRPFRRGRGGPMMRGGMMRGGMMGFKPGPPYVLISSSLVKDSCQLSLYFYFLFLEGV